MKKIISLLLVILMLCSMLFAVSCSDTSDDGDETSSSELPSQSAQELVEDSIEKIDNLDSYRAILTQNITVTMQVFTMQTPVTVDKIGRAHV